MPSFRTGTVAEVLAARPGLQRVVVDHEGQQRPAYVLTKLIGPVGPGDRVVVNTTAVDLGLGTGGWDVVHWNLSREAWAAPAGGHVMKLRYTSLQCDTGVAEEHDGYVAPSELAGLPVVACCVHSQVPCVAVAFKDAAPGARLVYVMTDGGALPLALSDVVASLRDAALLDATVTAGQAFGGDHEAVNVRSAIDVAVSVARADAVVVGTGPGVVGTASRHGTSALEVAAIVDAAGSGGALPIVALRWSDADERDRHRGLSHHSATALAAAHERAVVPVPAGETLPDLPGHDVVAIAVPDAAELLRGAGIAVTTMGRGPADDPRFFSYAAAAGVMAASLTPAR